MEKVQGRYTYEKRPVGTTWLDRDHDFDREE